MNVKLNDDFIVRCLKFKVSPMHNNANYFKGFFLAGYEKGLEEQQEKIDKLTKALEFYADKDNWHKKTDHKAIIKSADKEYLEVTNMNLPISCGGKLARQTLEDLK